MQRLGGVLVVLAGTALAGYLVMPAPQVQPGSTTEVVRSLPETASSANSSSATLPAALAAAELAPATQSQTSIVPGVAPTDTAERTSRVFSPAAPLSPAPATATTANAWTTVVKSETPGASKLKSSKPGDAETRAVLASDLQRELKRVGCYSGEVTGSWTPAAKRAMSAFMERVNATLPVEEPDYILLTLVQGHAANACGTDCPSGQVASDAGRCVPRAVVAQAAKKSQRDEERRAAEVRKAEQQERLAQEQRDADNKRLADSRKAKAAQVAAAATPSFTAPKIVHPKPQQTAAVEPEKLPWLDRGQASAAAEPAPAARGEPPAGMMSVGGPRQDQLDMPASATVTAPVKSPLPVARPGAASTIAAVEPANDDDAATPPSAKVSKPSKTSEPLSAPVAGLPGTKSGPAAHHATARPKPVKYQSAKVVRRPQPVVVYAAPKQKFFNTYASNGNSGKGRRYQPRPGTAHYNLLQSLGGIY